MNSLYHQKMTAFRFLACFAVAAMSLPNGFGAEETIGRTETPMIILLNRLNLDYPGLERVRELADKPDKAAKELLAYYRSRTSVRHPVDRQNKKSMLDKAATKEDLEIADDAVRNILIAAPVYPRFDFGDNIDWFRRHKDMEWKVQLHRHYSWLPLGKAYWHTGKRKYADAYTRQLADWLQDCTPHERHLAAWRRIEMGIRGHSWTHHFQYFIDASSYTPKLLVDYMNAVYNHANLLTKKEFTRSNWGLMEAEGVGFIAIFFPEFKGSPTWKKRALAHLNKDIEVQVRADGHQKEQCLNYHRGCITWFARTAELATLNKQGDAFPPEFWKRLEAMVAVLMQLGFPDGSSAQFGDTHSPVLYRSKLEKWGRYFKRPDFLFAATAGKKGQAPEQTAFALKESGFYSMRSSWSKDATCLVLCCGPHGGWHDQEHNGTFEIFANGKRLTPDSGSYIYSGDKRKWFKRTAIHQTLSLDLANASQEKQRLLLWKPGAKQDAVVVENDSYKGLTHRRAILFVEKTFFVIVDEAIGNAKGDVSIHFQLAPGKVTFDDKTLTVNTGTNGPSNLLVHTLPFPGLSLAEEEGWVSYKYGQREIRPAFRFHANKGGDSPGLRFVTILVPYTNILPDVSVEMVGDPQPGSPVIDLNIKLNGKHFRAGYSLAE